MGVNDSISSLVAAIKSTTEFKKLKQSFEAISSNPSLKKSMEDFSLEQKKVYTGNLTETEAKTRLKQLESKYDSVLKSPDITNYFKALGDFNKSMSNIIESIHESIDKSFK